MVLMSPWLIPLIVGLVVGFLIGFLFGGDIGAFVESTKHKDTIAQLRRDLEEIKGELERLK